ncbi:hypothetical protein MXB_4403, partial [Myxobolus squamalis]
MKYLIPSGLFAKDAHPTLLKNEIYRPKEGTLDRKYLVIYIKNNFPLYPGYYTSAPRFQDHLYKALFAYSTPIEKNWEPLSHALTFQNRSDFVKNINEPISQADFRIFINILVAISERPDARRFCDFLLQFHDEQKNEQLQPKEDESNTTETFRSMGYRKASVADVAVSRGSGNIIINFLPLSQAHAIRMAVSLCLVKFNPSWHTTLDKGVNYQLTSAKYLEMDYRIVERKKYARHKARKRYT